MSITFAQFLRGKLDDKKWDIKKLSEMTNIPRSTIQSYLTGTKPSDNNFELICNSIGVDPCSLTHLEDEKEYIRMPEARKRLGMKDDEIIQAILNGSLPGCTNGRTISIPRLGFENYQKGLTRNVIEACIRSSEGIMYEMLNSILKNAPSNQEQRIR